MRSDLKIQKWKKKTRNEKQNWIMVNLRGDLQVNAADEGLSVINDEPCETIV